MQIIKPAKLSLMCKTYGLKGHRFAVGVMSFFRLGAENELLSEQSQWPNIIKAWSDGTLPDLGYAKPKGEFLVSGKAFAPDGEPVTRMTVMAKLGNRKKKLKVVGDRLWNGLLFAPARLAEPFTSMPVNYNNAYGGVDYKLNPHGTGVIKSANKDPETGLYRLPNVYLPRETTFAAAGKRTVAGFGPLGIDWPQRGKYQGTYDRKWLEKVHPAFPDDTDDRLFNAAPADQQFRGYIKPGTPYEIHGMHPQQSKLAGKLPDLTARAFVEQLVDGERRFREIKTEIDTVWFFPEFKLGVMYHRGYIDATDSDGLDMKRLMLACEWSTDKPKSLDNYRQVMALRSDPQKAIAHVFNDAQLMPKKTEQQQAHIKQLVADEKKAQQQRIDTIKQIKLDQIREQYPDMKLDLPEPEPPEIPEPDPLPQALIEQGDADLSAHLEYAEAMSAKAKKDMEAKLAQAQAQKAQLQAQASGPKEEPIAHMQARVHTVIPVDFTAQTAAEPQNAPSWATQVPVDEKQQQQLLVAAQQLQMAARSARQQSPTVMTLTLPLPEHGELILRGWALQLLDDNQSLAGRDLAGIDLSGLDLSGYDLSDVMLEKANLKDCNFTGCNLSGAVMTEACIDGAVFDKARMHKANLSMVKAKNARFTNAQMTEMLLAQSRFDACVFDEAVIDQTMLLQVDLSGCSLSKSRITASHFVEADLNDSRWQQASLEKCILLQSTLNDSNWQGASLEKCIVLEAKAENADFSQVSAEKVQFSNKGDFAAANLSGGNWRVCGFRGLDLTNINGRSSVFKECDFAESDMTGADVTEALFDNCIMMLAKLNKADGRRAYFNETSLRKVTITDTDLRKTTMNNCDTHEMTMHYCRTRGFEMAPKPSIK